MAALLIKDSVNAASDAMGLHRGAAARVPHSRAGARALGGASTRTGSRSASRRTSRTGATRSRRSWPAAIRPSTAATGGADGTRAGQRVSRAGSHGSISRTCSSFSEGARVQLSFDRPDVSGHRRRQWNRQGRGRRAGRGRGLRHDRRPQPRPAGGRRRRDRSARRPAAARFATSPPTSPTRTRSPARSTPRRLGTAGCTAWCIARAARGPSGRSPRSTRRPGDAPSTSTSTAPCTCSSTPRGNWCAAAAARSSASLRSRPATPTAGSAPTGSPSRRSTT